MLRSFRWLKRELMDDRSQFVALGAGLCVIAAYFAAYYPHGGRHMTFILSRYVDPQIRSAFLIGVVFIALGLVGFKLKYDETQHERTRDRQE